MNMLKRSFGLVAITTIVLMVVTTIGSAINTAEAQRDRGDLSDRQTVNQAQGDNGQVQRGNLVGVQVGNTQVGANVGVPVNACVGVISENQNCNQR